MKTLTPTGLPAHPQTRAEWQQWVDHDLAFASRMLLRKGEIIQRFTLHSDDGLRTILAPFTSAEQRRGTLKFLAMTACAYEAHAVSMIGEAWMSDVADRAEAERIDRGEGLMPSQRETRQEVVTVMIFYRNAANERRAIGAVREIVRGEDGKPSELVRLAVDPGNDAAEGDGPQADFGGVAPVLQAMPPNAAQVALARELLTAIGPKLMQILGLAAI
jgi:hypothetical protein